MTRSRAYGGEADYQQVRGLLMESYALTGTLHNWGIDCLDWFRFNGHVFEEMAGTRRWETGVRLWETERGRLVGAAILDDGDLALQVHPHHRQLEAEMLDWAEQHHPQSGKAGTDSAPLSLYVYDYDHTRQAILGGRGYRDLGRDSYMRRRTLELPIPASSPPPGYAIRNLRGEEPEDLEKRAALANAAFGITKHTAQTIQMLQQAPTYDPKLDLVVIAPEGSFAAYCVVWFDAANRIGMLGPVGTHPAYRRRGLGKAAVAEGLHRLRAIEAKMAYVDCNLDEAANRLYEVAGFRAYDRVHQWQKERGWFPASR